jgi:hypothetical protein
MIVRPKSLLDLTINKIATYFEMASFYGTTMAVL